MKQLTKIEAIAFADSGVWKSWNHEQIVRFQLFQDKLCMDFGRFHEAGKSITALQALKKFHCFRLASRVNELKDKFKIHVEMIETKSGARIAKYSIQL